MLEGEAARPLMSSAFLTQVYWIIHQTYNFNLPCHKVFLVKFSCLFQPFLVKRIIVNRRKWCLLDASQNGDGITHKIFSRFTLNSLLHSLRLLPSQGFLPAFSKRITKTTNSDKL